MTTRSTASHELPGPSNQSIPERDGSAWTARLQRARDVLRGAVRGALPAAEPVDASPPPPVAAISVATDHPPPSESKRHREEDRTTRVYQRPAIESALLPIVVRVDLPREEVSTTSRLPSAELDALLLQVQYEAGSQAAATPPRHDPTSTAEMEVSSITFEELEAFRRSLVDSRAESDEEVISSTTPTDAPPPLLSTAKTSGSIIRRAQSTGILTIRWLGAVAARCVLLLRDRSRMMMAGLARLKTRYQRPKHLPIASGSRETADDASAPK